MKPIVYHTGLTPPPLSDTHHFEISYYPLLKVEYESSNAPQDISDILKQNPIIIMMSKNAVIGLEKWLSFYNLDDAFFAGVDFWTVGERTHSCLMDMLKISSFYPDSMTGQGVINALQKQKNTKVLLICGKDPQQAFISGLAETGINFFHFPVYQISFSENSTFSADIIDVNTNYLVVTSPTSVEGILKSLSLSSLKGLQIRIISIGPTTSDAIRKNGGTVFHESEIQNINNLYDQLNSLIIKIG